MYHLKLVIYTCLLLMICLCKFILRIFIIRVDITDGITDMPTVWFKLCCLKFQKLPLFVNAWLRSGQVGFSYSRLQLVMNEAILKHGSANKIQLLGFSRDFRIKQDSV